VQTHRNSCTRTHTYKQTHWHTRHKQNEGVAPENVRTRGWEWELSGKTEDEAAAMRLYLVPLRNYGSGNNNATGLLFLVAFTSRTHTHNLMWDTQAHTHRHTDVRWHCLPFCWLAIWALESMLRWPLTFISITHTRAERLTDL